MVEGRNTFFNNNIHSSLLEPRLCFLINSRLIVFGCFHNKNFWMQCWSNDRFLHTLSVLIFAKFGWFCKIKYTRNFLLNGIRENKYTPNMHKIHISRNKYTKRKYWLIRLFLESITTAFPSWPVCLSVDLDKSSQMSLGSIAFFLFFCLWGWGCSASLSDS